MLVYGLPLPRISNGMAFVIQAHWFLVGRRCTNISPLFKDQMLHRPVEAATQGGNPHNFIVIMIAEDRFNSR